MSDSQGPSSFAGGKTKKACIILFMTIAMIVLMINFEVKLPQLVPDMASFGITKDATASISTSTCGYRTYPVPNYSGLPYLKDVFLDPAGSHVVFVALTREEGCQNVSNVADDRFFWDKHHHKGIQFLCEFKGTSQKVLSNFIFPRGAYFSPAFSFKCKIPRNLLNKVSVDSKETQLHVSLYALNDLDDALNENDKPIPSHELISGIHSIPNIPVCSNLWDQHDTTPELSLGKKNKNLTLFTMLKLVVPNYYENHIYHENKTTNFANHLYEWIEYHRELGVDHFIIYNNDEDPQLQRKMLLPYVQQGIITHVWFPAPKCIFKDGFSRAQGQFAAELSAFYRYGAYTKFYGDIDVDEFLHVGTNGTNMATNSTYQSLPDLLDDKLVKSDYDVVRFRPYVFSSCNGSIIDSSMLLMEKRRCFTGSHKSDYKMIMKADRILNYVVHYPKLTVNWTIPEEYFVNEDTEGLLVHYRSGRKPGDLSDEFEGIVESKYNKEMAIMDNMLSKLKHRLKDAEKNYGINTTKMWHFVDEGFD